MQRARPYSQGINQYNKKRVWCLPVNPNQLIASTSYYIQVFVLADTTYNSLSVDEVAASHVEADCVVHYGRASLTKLSRIPAYYVFPSRELDVDAVTDALAESSFFAQENGANATNEDNINTAIPETIIFLDQVLLDRLADLKTALRLRLPSDISKTIEFANVPLRSAEPSQKPSKCCEVDGGDGGGNCSGNESEAACCQTSANNSTETAGYTWHTNTQLANTTLEHHRYRFVWIGSLEAPALRHLQLTYSSADWLTVDPFSTTNLQYSIKIEHGLPLEVSKLLKRRYFLVEKARNANIVGILVGTLGAAGYGDALRQLRKAAQSAGKKTYTMLMGKPSPAKLANFPEVDVFVLVADPQGQILDSKEYLAPIITPHEAMLAFSEEYEWKESEYKLDFDHILSTDSDFTSEQVGNNKEEEIGALAVQAQQALIVTPAAAGAGHLVEVKSAADYLVHKRSWTGVETPLVGSEKKEAHLAVPGQSGRAAGYSHEEKK
jgi:diphthamide biosynthesis protein 2